MRMRTFTFASLLAGAAAAQQPEHTGQMTAAGAIAQRGEHIGQMTASAPQLGTTASDVLIFEPFQLADAYRQRTDLIFLMRHGPATLDQTRGNILSELGQEEMLNLAILMILNGVEYAQLASIPRAVSLETRGAFEEAARIFSNLMGEVEVIDIPNGTQGALEATIDAFVEDGAEGPLVIVSDFDSIRAFTDFNTFEGEMLVLDPTRDNRVLGYFRLLSAGPDLEKFRPRAPGMENR